MTVPPHGRGRGGGAQHHDGEPPSRHGAPRLTRRAVLAMLAAGAVACTGRVLRVPSPGPEVAASESPTPRPTQAPRPTVSPSPSPSPSPAPSPTLTAVAPYEPLEGDVYPNAKRLAGRFAQALATYEVGADARGVLRDAAERTDPDFDGDEAAREAGLLLVPGARSVGEVVYAQLGGLDPQFGPRQAAVMVVVRQALLTDDGARREVTRTLDVRLANRGDGWELARLASGGGAQAERPRDLPDYAVAVAADGRIELPDSALWDIYRGGVDERLLRAMTAMAGIAPYSVAVLKTGHPIEVFGSAVTSNHTAGRAVDIWAIDGRPVVVQQPDVGTPAFEFTEGVFDFDSELVPEVPELGAPWDLDGAPPPGGSTRSFTDPVHADHLHVATSAIMAPCRACSPREPGVDRRKQRHGDVGVRQLRHAQRRRQRGGPCEAGQPRQQRADGHPRGGSPLRRLGRRCGHRGHARSAW